MPTAPGSGEESSLRSAAGLLALQTLPAIGQQTALRFALLATEVDPFLAEHVRLWPRQLAAAEEEIERCREAGIAVISIFDSAYPERLRAIEDPPPVLYIQGALEVLRGERAVALTGTREPSEAGIAATEQVVAALAGDRWVVLGCLGKGVEIAAHRAALAHETPTVAVLPGGLEVSLAKRNQELAEAILAQGGALLSEHRMDFASGRSSAIQRYRLETALAAALILTETSLADGSMYTVRYAAMQGCPIFCAEPSEENDLRALHAAPAEELVERVPTWRHTVTLDAALGDQPLAQALAPDDPNALLAALERVIAAERQHPPEPKWWPAPKGKG
jgi:DNA protecting protein DprA